ncbi:PA5502 family lipoprotein [Pseudomonas zhanjiangensis]|uniref:PA5502 family lipoprotein n=1 Tax=Pseudomonas zhanjiangensis TaxID=3239015 RepID=A0ABV3YMI0_9PSED
MKSFASGCLSIVALSLLLAACQSAPQVANPPTDELVSAFRQLDQSLSAGQLEQAERQLADLQRRTSGDTRLEQYQRQLAEAYLQQGQRALRAGDLDRAATALGQARSLMPQAPALTTGLEGAITQARQVERDNAERARQAAEQAEAARLEQARQLRQAAEHQAAAIQATQTSKAPEALKPLTSARAQVIDPTAAKSRVPLPMLDNQDNERLRSLLDRVAQDIVTFRCTVSIEVREARDYLWVAALLNARIKRLDPGFSPQLERVIKPQQDPQLVLSPQAKP